MLNAANLALFFGVLFGISEALALIPQVKSNSVFQSVQSVIGLLVGVIKGPKA